MDVYIKQITVEFRFIPGVVISIRYALVTTNAVREVKSKRGGGREGGDME